TAMWAASPAGGGGGDARHSLDLFLRETGLTEVMPMSPLDSILGLEGLFIEQVQRAHDIHVWARPRKRACCVHCANPRVRIKATYTRTLKHTPQGNQLMCVSAGVILTRRIRRTGSHRR